MDRHRELGLRCLPRALSFAFLLAAMALATRPTPVAAECIFVPPWPAITTAIPSARVIVVGDVVADFDPSQLQTSDGGPRTKALRVTEVLRGPHTVGDLVDIQWLLPNWPWTVSSADLQAYPSCSYLQGVPGETIAIAFDALQPGQDLSVQDEIEINWHQPPTRYNAMGVIAAEEPSAEWGADRERVTLSQLRNLAALPAADTLGPADEPRSSPWLGPRR
jgi:hypothetical protein